MSNSKELLEDIELTWETADCLYTEQQLEQSISRMAESICRDLVAKNPVALCVMNGGLVTAGQLLPKLPFNMQLDFIHASRYREGTTGNDIEWRVRPHQKLKGRCVLVIDDILDEGVTLKEIRRYCLAAGAEEVKIAVLVKKLHHHRVVDIQADYVAVEVPDRYVFGYGMDYKGYLRNMPGIYAVKGL